LVFEAVAERVAMVVFCVDCKISAYQAGG